MTHDEATRLLDTVDAAILAVQQGGRRPVALVMERWARRRLRDALRIVGTVTRMELSMAELAQQVDGYVNLPIVVGEAGTGAYVVGLGSGLDHRHQTIDVEQFREAA